MCVPKVFIQNMQTAHSAFCCINIHVLHCADMCCCTNNVYTHTHTHTHVFAEQQTLFIASPALNSLDLRDSHLLNHLPN